MSLPQHILEIIRAQWVYLLCSCIISSRHSHSLWRERECVCCVCVCVCVCVSVSVSVSVSVPVSVPVREIKHLVSSYGREHWMWHIHDASSEGLYSPPTPSSGMRLRKELKGRTMPASRCGVHKVWIVALVLFICVFCLHCFTKELCKSSHGPTFLCWTKHLNTYQYNVFLQNLVNFWWITAAVINRKCTKSHLNKSGLQLLFVR